MHAHSREGPETNEPGRINKVIGLREDEDPENCTFVKNLHFPKASLSPWGSLSLREDEDPENCTFVKNLHFPEASLSHVPSHMYFSFQ